MKGVVIGTGRNIISRTTQEDSNLLCDYYMTAFDKSSCVRFSGEIDTTKVEVVTQTNRKQGHIVRGATNGSLGGDITIIAFQL